MLLRLHATFHLIAWKQVISLELPVLTAKILDKFSLAENDFKNTDVFSEDREDFKTIVIHDVLL